MSHVRQLSLYTIGKLLLFCQMAQLVLLGIICHNAAHNATRLSDILISSDVRHSAGFNLRLTSIRTDPSSHLLQIRALTRKLGEPCERLAYADSTAKRRGCNLQPSTSSLNNGSLTHFTASSVDCSLSSLHLSPLHLAFMARWRESSFQPKT